MTDLTSLTLAQARDALREKEFSAIEFTEAHLAAVEGARAPACRFADGLRAIVSVLMSPSWL
jgi:Asp-tRNA(Asn)/Glu-tRNA(Gln) amidotransferase A subunit family amidase